MSEIIAISNARKRSGVYFKKNDVEEFPALVFYAIRKYFDPKRPPHDLNAFVNTVINNKLADLMKERIKEKKMREDLTLNYGESLKMNEFNNFSYIDKMIMVKEAIKKIKPLCQKIIYLVAERYKVSDIIIETGLNIREDAMRQRIRECRKSLGQYLKDSID